jgi:hypothetical protein
MQSTLRQDAQIPAGRQCADAAIFASRVLFEGTLNDIGRCFNMNSSKKTGRIAALLAFCLALTMPMLVSAREVDSSIAACLKAWGNAPFGKNPQFKTLEMSLTVFGIGKKAGDTKPTSSPSLVLVNPIFNVMGGSTIELLNPNGWYCLRTAVSVLGMLTIRVQCKAHLAVTSNGRTMQGDNAQNRGIRDFSVTSVGSVSVKRPCK